MVAYIKKSAGFWAALLLVGVFLIFNRASWKKNQAVDLELQAFQIEAGWGYKVLNRDSLLINQPFIPLISGVKRFKTEDDALKTGSLMVAKIKAGVFPPTINLRELDSLHIVR